MEKSALPNGTTLLGTDIIFIVALGFSQYFLLCGEWYTISADKGSIASISTVSTKVVYPDTSKMVIYDPKHNPGNYGLNFHVQNKVNLIAKMTWIEWTPKSSRNCKALST